MKEEYSDEALLGQYLNRGDVRAFETLVLRHRNPLFNFIVRFVGSREKSEDLLQELMLKLATRGSEWEGRASLKTWLFSIARNLCLDELRRARHRNALSLNTPLSEDSSSISMIDTVPGSDPPPDSAAGSSMLQPVLIQAINSLPDDQREVFLLREYAGLSFKEIAKITGTKLNTNKSKMRYALEGLRRFLQANGVHADDEHYLAEAEEKVWR